MATRVWLSADPSVEMVVRRDEEDDDEVDIERERRKDEAILAVVLERREGRLWSCEDCIVGYEIGKLFGLLFGDGDVVDYCDIQVVGLVSLWAACCLVG